MRSFIRQPSFFSALMLLLLTLPVAVQAQFTFTTNSGALTITKYTGPGGDVIIPNSTNGLAVSTIGTNAFENCTNVTSVTIGTNVTSIGDMAFYYCTNLGNVTIPNSVTSIRAYAFYDCRRLTSITIPSSVANIDDWAFSHCSSLKSVYFQGNAPSLGAGVFWTVFYDPDGTVIIFTDPAFVYYLPGTTVWGPTFGGLPAKLWNPLIQASGPSFGVHNNTFAFNVIGTTNIPIVVEASTNSASAAWTALQTCTLTNGLIYFSDLAWSNYPARFYRIRSP